LPSAARAIEVSRAPVKREAVRKSFACRKAAVLYFLTLAADNGGVVVGVVVAGCCRIPPIAALDRLGG
jgi:hypothetical protein